MPFNDITKTSMEDLNRVDLQTFKSNEKIPLVLVLDNIRSLQNVGSFFRTADAFKIEKILLVGITGTPPNKEIEKTALGATESIDYQYFKSEEEAVNYLQKEQYLICSIEQTNQSQMLNDITFEGDKYAFIFGNEVFGVHQTFLEASDMVLEIPQFGTKHSLNVSVSAGILIWHFYSKNKVNFF
ncbi:TrmH family RNA methyltransferase [Jiulongibacter sp. NS-SX5]|uniref:TrmH family RNA methyltransferase n=1 Tax=Jiulongibacter sp. NS-SX5 TaxID=3463854 RepID=UPI0040592B0B